MTQTSTNSQDWRVDYLLLAALWGSSFLFMRMGASEFGPLATAWGRVFVATLFLGPLMLFKGHWKVFLQNWKLVLGLGAFNSALPFALFAYAILHISTGLSAILNAAVPLFAAVVAWAWLGDRLLGRTRTVVLGALLMTAGHFGLASETLFFVALLLLPAAFAQSAYLLNIATRASVGGAAGNPIPGFVLAGQGTKQVLVRAADRVRLIKMEAVSKPTERNTEGKSP